MTDHPKLPVLEFDWMDERIRSIADNIFHAQSAGWPAVLTYDRIADDIARKKRRSAMRVEESDLLEQDGSWRPGTEALRKSIREGGALRVPTIRNADPALNLPSRDEYPFACTREHAGKVWVGHVPPEQNSLQGWMIQDFLRNHGATDGFRFVVRVVNRPQLSQSGPRPRGERR